MFNMLSLYKALGALLFLSAAFWYVFSLGADSRQDEVDEGAKVLSECRAASKFQNAAVADLKTRGEAQDQKISLAQEKAAKLLRNALALAQRREPVPQECDAAIKWGETKINELTDRWNHE